MNYIECRTVNCLVTSQCLSVPHAGHEATMWREKVCLYTTYIIFLSIMWCFLNLLCCLQRGLWIHDCTTKRERKVKEWQRWKYHLTAVAGSSWWLWRRSNTLCLSIKITQARPVTQSPYTSSTSPCCSGFLQLWHFSSFKSFILSSA